MLSVERFEQYRETLGEIEQHRLDEVRNLMEKINAGNAQLYRIWYSDGNDRREQSRVVAEDIGEVFDFIRDNYLNPEYLDEVEETEFGFMWSLCDVETCKEYSEEENPCFNCCESPTGSFYIEEVEDPDEDELEFKTIFGANELYIVTDGVAKQADDWNPLLTMVLKLSELLR